jgi:adenylate cyclase, class 2
MAREIEIKLRVEDVAALERKLRRVGARTVATGSGRVHEWNTLYDTAGADLRRREELLRVRVETPAEAPGSKRKSSKRGEAKVAQRFILTFKGPIASAAKRAGGHGADQSAFGGNHKVREEIELEVGDSKALGTIFARLGMRESFHYEKYRTTFRMPDSARWARGLLIEVDETPIGNFVELEGPSASIDRVAKLLGFSKDEYVLTNYLRLHAEECKRRGARVGDMVFRKRK